MALRFRNQISPLRRGFLLFGAGFRGAGRNVGVFLVFLVFLLVLMVLCRVWQAAADYPRRHAGHPGAEGIGRPRCRAWRCRPDGGVLGHGGGATAMRVRRIVHARWGHGAKHGAQIWTCARAFGYREICPSRQFPSGMWRLRPISPPVAAGGHDRFIGCLDAYEDVRGVRRVGLTPAAGRHIASGNPSAFVVRARRAPRPSAIASAI